MTFRRFGRQYVFRSLLLSLASVFLSILFFSVSTHAQWQGLCDGRWVPDASGLGYTCIPNNRSPAGKVPCGGGYYCQKGQRCCGTGCCRIDQECCGSYCCNPGNYCSKYGCIPHGSVDCGTYYCPPGKKCGPYGSNCYDKSVSNSQICLNGEYCPEGYICKQNNNDPVCLTPKDYRKRLRKQNARIRARWREAVRAEIELHRLENYVRWLEEGLLIQAQGAVKVVQLANPMTYVSKRAVDSVQGVTDVVIGANSPEGAVDDFVVGAIPVVDEVVDTIEFGRSVYVWQRSAPR